MQACCMYRSHLVLGNVLAHDRVAHDAAAHVRLRLPRLTRPLQQTPLATSAFQHGQPGVRMLSPITLRHNAAPCSEGTTRRHHAQHFISQYSLHLNVAKVRNYPLLGI